MEAELPKLGATYMCTGGSSALIDKLEVLKSRTKLCLSGLGVESGA